MARNGFNSCRVADLIQTGALAVNDGYRVRNVELGPRGTPFVRGGDIGDGWIETAVTDHIRPEFADRLDGKLTQPEDVAFITKGTVGRVGRLRVGQPKVVFAPQVSFWRVLDRNVLDPRFLFYLLRGAEFQSNLDAVKTHGSMVADYVSMSDQKLFRLTIPPIHHQRVAARILGALDDKIELNRRMNETLEGMARTLFKSWFVDFDPVRAKLDGRPLPNLDPATAALFPDHFEHTNGEIIPKGWRLGQIRDLAGFQGGYAFKSKDWVDEGVPVVKIGSVKPGIVDIDDVSYVTPEIAAEASRFKLDTGDLLIGMTGYVGEVGLIPPNSTPPLLNQRVGKFVLQKPGTAELAFIYCLTRGADFKTAVEAKSHGTAQANVSAEGILSVETIVPMPAIRNAFNRHCAPLLDRILENHGESRTLAALRDALLPKLLSGEIRIPAAECAIDKAFR